MANSCVLSVNYFRIVNLFCVRFSCCAFHLYSILVIVLGISAFYHDSSVAFIQDGEIIFAAQEERFTRKKHDDSFPIESLKTGLKYLNLNPDQIEAIVFFEKPFLKFERLIETYLAFAPKGYMSFIRSIPLWLKEKLFQKNEIINNLVSIGFSKENAKDRLYFSDHHLSHAASAYFPSPFSEALILTMDGVGEWATTTVYLGKKNKLEKIKQINFPHSLGLLYSAFTYYCGFKVNSGEYKLMGLAPYGRPIYIETILKELIDVKDDGSFRLNMKYFDYCTGLKMTNKFFDQLFDFSFRRPEDELRQVHMDLAASIQIVLQDILVKICTDLRKIYGINNICLAGGVALNCVANSALLNTKIFDGIWVQPAAGDAGGALGAALAYYYKQHERSNSASERDQMKGSYLGNDFSDSEIENQLKKVGARFQKKSEIEIISHTAQDLIENKAVGWFQGRMEYGPRALGNRSILANPLSAHTQRDLNLKIKYRESFRPFAPAVLEEFLPDWFDMSGSFPYMLFVGKVQKNKRLDLSETDQSLFGLELLNIPKSVIPAVTHVDYTARVQTVSKSTNLKFHELISAFNQKSQVPILVNTSFNVRGEPIVCSPADAFRCFMGTELDTLVIGNYYLSKSEQNAELGVDYKQKFTND